MYRIFAELWPIFKILSSADLAENVQWKLFEVPTTPQTRLCTTMWNINAVNYNVPCVRWAIESCWDMN